MSDRPNLKHTSIRLPVDAAKALKTTAARLDVTEARLIRYAISEVLSASPDRLSKAQLKRLAAV